MKRVAAVLEVSFFALGSVAVEGADKKFVWAGAAIEGDSVVVSSAQVAGGDR